MRPLDKGACPQVNGINKTVTDYREWRDDLINRIDRYCAYCNMKLNQSLQVEHVVPKVPVAGAPIGAMLDWDNMLLACGPCNRAKWNFPCNDTLYYLPESHNTFLAFQVVPHSQHAGHAIPSPANALNATQRAKASSTINFFELENVDTRRAVVDLRSRDRFQAMLSVASALRSHAERKLSVAYDPIDAAKDVAMRARDAGFFNLWFEAFANEPTVMEQLVNNDPHTRIICGTAQNCFDPAAAFTPIFRNPGAVDPL